MQYLFPWATVQRLAEFTALFSLLCELAELAGQRWDAGKCCTWTNLSVFCGIRCLKWIWINGSRPFELLFCWNVTQEQKFWNNFVPSQVKIPTSNRLFLLIYFLNTWIFPGLGLLCKSCAAWQAFYPQLWICCAVFQPFLYVDCTLTVWMLLAGASSFALHQ